MEDDKKLFEKIIDLSGKWFSKSQSMIPRDVLNLHLSFRDLDFEIDRKIRVRNHHIKAFPLL